MTTFPSGFPADRATRTDDFDGPGLDPTVWLPHYLPHWSSRATTEATWSIADSRLSLSIPPRQGLWCAEDHSPPLRVSALQTGEYAGPAGSTVGQQPFREGQTVREEQPRFEGLLVDTGRVELTCRMRLGPRSMASLWLVGFEEHPERCGEICVVEVFGRALGPGSAEVGHGLHAFRDPALVEDFQAPRLDLDVAETHTYGVTWDRTEAVFDVDGRELRRCGRPPAYPLQLMLGVFDFPTWPGPDDEPVPVLEVDRVLVGRAGTT